MTEAPYNYAGEAFLSTHLPDYDSDRMYLIVQLILVFLSWVVVLPVMMATPLDPLESSAPPINNGENNPLSKAKKVTSKSTRKKGKGNKIKSEGNTTEKQDEEEALSPVQEISTSTNMICIVGFLLTFCYMIVTGSPDNRYTTRGVFEAPLLSPEECQFLVDLAEKAALKNYELAKTSSNKNQKLLLEHPAGWQKKRHRLYSTTDLNLVTDPFTKQDRKWLQQKLDARLATTIQRVYGVPISSIRANDIFIIRYDGDRQAALTPHTDDGDITFSVLLSDGFTGGGTNYYDRQNQYYHSGNKPYTPRPDEVFAHVLPDIGQMTLFRAPVLHEGVQVKEGRRYLLIGFLSVDNIDPWAEKPKKTGLSWFASWLSLNWAAVRFRAGYQSAIYTHASALGGQELFHERDADWVSDSTYIRGLMMQMHIFLTTLADLTSKHFFQRIIPDTDNEAFLKALDQAYFAESKVKSDGSKNRASWFSGQQVDLRVGGSLSNEWSTRESNSDKFEDVELER